MLITRILTAIVLLPLVILAVWFGTPVPWFTIIAALIALLGAEEFFRLTGLNGNKGLRICGDIFTILLVIHPHFDWQYTLPAVLGIGIIASLAVTIWFVREQSKFIRWSWMMLGSLYIGWLVSLLVYLRLVPGTADFPELGRNLVFLALLATFGTDTFAYFVGKLIGRHKMAPAVSPGKTWEGAAGGLAAAVLISWLFTLDWPLQLPVTVLEALVLGGMISIFAQLGDLAESFLKRLVGTKDSGILMPGHGGILDRIDSILPAAAVVYIFYTLFLP